MCPDDQLLSAHLDKEVPSPWSEKLTHILESDSECKKRFERLQAVRTVLHAQPEPDFAGAQDRVWQELEKRKAFAPVPHRFRTISVSLPAAAAAAMAILAVGVLASYVALRPPAQATAAVGPAAIAEGLTVRVEDIEQLLRIINAGEPVRQVQIDLPDQSRFQFAGEPRLIRAVDQGGARPFGESEEE